MNPTNEIAIVLLCTKREYELGFFQKCLDSYFDNNCSRDHSVDLFLFFNTGNRNDYPLIDKYLLNKNINDIKFHSFNYSEAQDIYFRTPQEMRKFNSKTHELGGSGGANLLFFDSMLSLIGLKYKNYLMIESDSRPIKSFWLDLFLRHYTFQDFLIFGSRYKGLQELPKYESWTGHLNGIAIYKNNNHLKHLLQEARSYIKYSVYHNINQFMSFDVAIWLFSKTLNFQNYLNSHRINYEVLVNSKVISNYSLFCDLNLSRSEILKRDPETIILHQKWN